MVYLKTQERVKKMKIGINIPGEFEEHFKQDKFKESLERIMADLENSLCAGNYEYETIKMLEKALENSELAYDVNKVVERLEIERGTADRVYDLFNMNTDLGYALGLKKAIEIVKAGDKEWAKKN